MKFPKTAKIFRKKSQNNPIKPSQSQEMQEKEPLFDYFYDQPGTTPGTISIEEDASPSEIVIIDYNQDGVYRLSNLTPEDCASHLDSESVSWIDVSGLGSRDVLERLGNVFQLHPLILEDIVNVPQRPKIEEYPNQLLIVTQMVMLKDEGKGFWLEQVSFILGRNYLLTVQEESERDTFKRVRDRLRDNRGIIRQKGNDYLTYALWDTIIDGYFPVLEVYGELLQDLEDEVVHRPTDDTLRKIYEIKRELLLLRRAIWPQRDALNSLVRDGNHLIHDDILRYLKDCSDHIVQIIDIIETYRELTSGLMDVYLSVVSNKMNEVMKFLTVIATTFIPLSFIAGVYGMNFDTEKSPWNMPELNWYFGYPFCLSLMLAAASTMLFYFWKQGWFKKISDLN